MQDVSTSQRGSVLLRGRARRIMSGICALAELGVERLQMRHSPQPLRQGIHQRSGRRKPFPARTILIAMDMRSLVAEEARRLRLKRAQTEAKMQRASNPAAWRQPTCRHCPTLRHDRMEAAIHPMGGHLLLKRESPTSVHIAVAKRPFATYCDYLQDRAPGARPGAAALERKAVSRYLERFRLGRATEAVR